jgi:hypothetical protein
MVVCYQILLRLRADENLRLWKMLALFALLGALCGAAGSAKLNGLAALGAGFALAVFVGMRWRGSLPGRLWAAGLCGLTVAVSAVLAFLALNPYLWLDPIGRTILMFTQKIDELSMQQRQYPGAAIHGLREGARLVSIRVLQSYATIRFRFAFILNFSLCLLGLWYSGRKSLLWLRSSSAEPASLTLLLFALTVAIPPFFSPLDWGRYFLLPIVYSTIFIAIGAASIAVQAHQTLRARSLRGRSTRITER